MSNSEAVDWKSRALKSEASVAVLVAALRSFIAIQPNALLLPAEWEKQMQLRGNTAILLANLPAQAQQHADRERAMAAALKELVDALTAKADRLTIEPEKLIPLIADAKAALAGPDAAGGAQ